MENENTKNNGLINEMLEYLGGKTAFLITAGIVTFIFLVTGIYVSAVVRPRTAKAAMEKEIAASEAEVSRQIEESIRQSEAEEIYASFNGTGVYVGNGGSVLILYDNGLADYYHSVVGLNSSNEWSYSDGTINISIDCLFCDVESTFDMNNPNQFVFTSNSIYWDDETFELVTNEASAMTVDELQVLVDEYSE